MRNEVLHGYLIHHRKYRDRSHIIHLFSQEYGRIDGILRQMPAPQYQPLCLQATGKSALKNFSKLEIVSKPIFFYGDAFFAGFYLNEILLRLCPIEEPMPQTFQQYHITIAALQQLSEQADPSVYLKQILRQFEYVLLEELGYALSFDVDAQQQVIQAQQRYELQLNEGFVAVSHRSAATVTGEQILTMTDYVAGDDFNAAQLQLLTKLYRQLIAALLGDRPLKSRQLWIQNIQSKR